MNLRHSPRCWPLSRSLWRRGIVALVACASSLLLSCDTRGVVGGECAHGLSPCGRLCVNVGNDSEHCGACGVRCDADEVCQAGACMTASDETDDPTGGRDSSGEERDAGVDGGRGGGDSTRPGGGFDGGGAGVDGGPTPCFPPYNSAEHCGACDNTCQASTPFCAPVDDSFECVSGCPDGLLLCGDRCVDPTSDPLHCGGCNRLCPTGLCRDSKCVGEMAGHIIMMCISFEQVFPSSPQAVLVSNSALLGVTNTVRVMVYERHTSGGARRSVRNIISSAAERRGRAAQFASVDNAEQVVSDLNVLDYDVFLMLDQPAAPAGLLPEFGRTISPALREFTSQGGIVILLTGSQTDEAAQLLNDDGAGLLEVSALHDVTFSEVEITAPADSIAAGALTPFLALTTTCVYETPAMSGGELNVVVSGPSPGDAGGLLPVVLHRVVEL